MTSYPSLVALSFVKSKTDDRDMGNRRQDSKAKYGKRKNRSEDAFRFSEDRLQLLDTIHEMVSDEFQIRGLDQKGNPHPENPPPEVPGEACCGRRDSRPSLWQRIRRILRDNKESSPTE